MAVGDATAHIQRIEIKRCRMTSAPDRLISGLVEDLKPIRPQPRLRQAFAIILALWTTLLGVVLWTQENDAGLGSLYSNRIYLWSFLGLVVASCSATISALAAGVPGRDRLEIGAMVFSWLGLVIAAVACLLGMNALGPSTTVSPDGADAMCFQKSALLSLLPAGVVLSFLVRGCVSRPFRAALVALVASGAIGASIVHASCHFVSPRHLLMGHLSVPLALALFGFYPLATILRRLRG